ncbi:uncharacterized protein LOC121835685 [Ixodes scapularis]|uniref:uncharacterized protein LOC121835685 n=1 Tax=Ixodes scapularis TaxID=6945 RepID=UPI001C394D84|nr:uncharacterized protein LOC121835685 [Ixodes scapularis]
MLATTLFTVIIATFGPITCDEVPPFWGCPDKPFDDPGYSLGCTYPCKNGNPQDPNTYWGRYMDGTVCVVLEGGDSDKLDHIGTCDKGICVEYKEENIHDVWSKLPETQPEFRNCDDKSSKEPVEKCLHICNKTHSVGKYGLFLGIYLDHNPCKFKTGPGRCRSGLCIDEKIGQLYPIEN